MKKSKPQPVYNLQVEDVPEFFANGILVHNCDSTRMLTVGFGPIEQGLTPAQKVQAAIPAGYHKQELAARTDMTPDQRHLTGEMAEWFAKRLLKGKMPKPKDNWGQPLGR